MKSFRYHGQLVSAELQCFVCKCECASETQCLLSKLLSFSEGISYCDYMAFKV